MLVDDTPAVLPDAGWETDADADAEPAPETGPITPDVVESEPPAPVCDGVFTPPTGSAEVRCSYFSEVETRGGYTGHPDIKERVIGTNAEFEDACTADGNLVEGTCEAVELPEYMGNNAWRQVWRQTGVMLSVAVDCGGRCLDGRCPQSCPSDEEFVRVIRRDSERVRLRACGSGVDYDCPIDASQPPEYDCDGALVPEAILTMLGGPIERGSGTATCTAALSSFVVGAAYPIWCTLRDCRLELPEM